LHYSTFKIQVPTLSSQVPSWMTDRIGFFAYLYGLSIFKLQLITQNPTFKV